jgi:hypothetical protein
MELVGKFIFTRTTAWNIEKHDVPVRKGISPYMI